MAMQGVGLQPMAFHQVPGPGAPGLAPQMMAGAPVMGAPPGSAGMAPPGGPGMPPGAPGMAPGAPGMPPGGPGMPPGAPGMPPGAPGMGGVRPMPFQMPGPGFPLQPMPGMPPPTGARPNLDTESLAQLRFQQVAAEYEQITKAGVDPQAPCLRNNVLICVLGQGASRALWPGRARDPPLR